MFVSGAGNPRKTGWTADPALGYHAGNLSFPHDSRITMPDDLDTVSLHALIHQYRAGDVAALNTLISRTAEQLERLARRMLRDFPGVRAKEQTGDVLNSALVRLQRALREANPTSVRQYYALAAEQIRRELLDLVRKYKRRPVAPLADAEALAPPVAVAADLDLWAALQEAVEKLPTDLREVFGLTFYHGWNQAAIAELLQTHDKRVRQMWRQACQRLSAAVGGELPAA
jgi:RNA polymerase sigma factor (sigma-70 family)